MQQAPLADTYLLKGLHFSSGDALEADVGVEGVDEAPSEALRHDEVDDREGAWERLAKERAHEALAGPEGEVQQQRGLLRGRAGVLCHTLDFDRVAQRRVSLLVVRRGCTQGRVRG